MRGAWIAVVCVVLVGCGDSDGNDNSNQNVPDPVDHAGVTASQEGDVVILSNGVVTVRFGLAEGTYAVGSVDGSRLHLVGAEGRAHYQVGDEPDQVSGTTDEGTRS